MKSTNKQPKYLFMYKLFMLALFILAPLWSVWDQLFVNGYLPNYVTVDIKVDQNRCNDSKCTTDYLPGRYTFTNEEIAKAKAIPGISKSYLENFYGISVFNDGTFLKENNITKLNETPPQFTPFPINTNDVGYKFISLAMPLTDLEKTGKIEQTYYATKLINGQYENSNSPDVPGLIIPSNFAENKGYNVGQTIDLKVQTVDQQNISKETTKKYFVSGIYDVLKTPREYQGNFYVPFVDTTKITASNQFQTLEEAKYFEINGLIPKTDKEHQKYLKTFATFQAANQTDYVKMHFITNDKSDEVTKQLQALFPEYTVTNYQNYVNPFFEHFQTIIIGVLSLIAFLFFLMIIFFIFEVRKSTYKFKFWSNFLRNIAVLVILYLSEHYIMGAYQGYTFELNYLIIIILGILTLLITALLHRISSLYDYEISKGEENEL